MGWTQMRATCFTKGGSVNRKAECDQLFAEGYHVLKSRMVGSTYYAAVEHEGEVSASVILTRVVDKGYTPYILYKGISEDMGPVQQECPKTILDLLTSTTNKTALDWRYQCYKNLSKKSLSDFGIGSEISFSDGENTYHLKKMAPAYQFKTPYWAVVGTNKYMPRTRIHDYSIIKEVS